MSHNIKQWSSATPGYLIFLIDQSGSMGATYSENKNKANFTATVINRTINELININMDGEKVKDRVFISLIVYGEKCAEIRSDYLSTFAEKPLRIENGKQKISNGEGGLIEIDVQTPIFIEPIVGGGTPMGNALVQAKKLIAAWLSDKPENPAPVIINVSDGMPNNKIQCINEADAIMNLSCKDGHPLIFNAHIGSSLAKCICSASESELPNEQAKFLFKISSKIPESYMEAAKKQELEIKENSKGFVSNADPETFIKFINFGSSGGGVDRKNKLNK